MNLNQHTHHINTGPGEEAKEKIYHSPSRRRVNTVAHSNLSSQFFPPSKSGHKPQTFFPSLTYCFCLTGIYTVLL
ncbi:hypothetical protein VIGAN_08321000 [Vigna angularis var. angularis]|uniref:Uncharacterized protein n=1 Tax=Vigna angularis var. angularis TaxID=157739 RepID=A0A0S3STX5_PHAAN|nr:hypothetical protein VIGAN_08321000 [Vigna angularis var. angularis]